MLGGVLLYVLLGVAIITLRYIERLLEGKSVWAEWEGDPGGFCEGLADRADDFVREPVNAWSAMVYFVAGLAITLVALKDLREPVVGGEHSALRACPALSLVCGLTSCAHAAAAFLNHACRCHVGHMLDTATMYALAYFVTLATATRCIRVVELHALPRERGDDSSAGAVDAVLPPPWTLERKFRFTAAFVAAFVVGCFAFASMAQPYYSDPGARDREQFVMVALIGMALGFHVVSQALALIVAHSKLVYSGCALLVASFVCHILDVNKIMCVPGSPYQLHAAHDICGGFALVIFFSALRSETMYNIVGARTKAD